MKDIFSAIEKLHHKDVRIRRKAVRNLFEMNNPIALEGFCKLLDDEENWFQNKAIDAYRKWASKEDDLRVLIEKGKTRLAAELLEQVEASDLAIELLDSEDYITRAFSGNALKTNTEYHDIMSRDEHHSVRIIVAENSTDSGFISKLISDNHSSVRREAIASASRNMIELDDKTLERGLTSSDPSLRSLISALIVKKGGPLLERVCNDSNPKVRSSIADTLRKEVLDLDERIELISKIQPSLLLRWLRNRKDPHSNSLRWSLIENQDIDNRTRSKLIEQMDGQTDVDLARLAIISEDDSVLVKMAANNLSASVSELTGEGL
ncbi:MAG: hypothetical protein QGI21_00370 [Candidatus Poseidoniaceae archaeon]|jgi:hypothetical protein|nr:hypothetical protein [Candidatus Poseidoniaceae archaeon]